MTGWRRSASPRGRFAQLHEALILLIEVGVDLGLVFTRHFQFTGAHHSGDQLRASDLPELDEFEAECFDHGEHAIQRGTIDQRTRQDGEVALRPRAEAGTRCTEGSSEAASDADLIVLLWHRCSVSWSPGPSGRRQGWCVRP